MMGVEPPKGMFAVDGRTEPAGAAGERATDQLLKELGFTPDQWTQAHQLVATHGRAAGQVIVDRIQEALRAGDEEAAHHYDRVLTLVGLRKRYSAPATSVPRQSVRKESEALRA